jgi:hypothetical protein
MNKKFVLLLMLICCVSLLRGQKTRQLPNVAKNGIFYFYPQNSKESFRIVRDDSIQQEINLNTGDTSIWRIKWQNDTGFKIRYLTGTKKLPDAEISFMKAHSAVVQIEKITSGYYTFSIGLDSANGIHSAHDTMWLKPKINRNSN